MNRSASEKLPSLVKANFLLWSFALLKVPMLFMVRPKVIGISTHKLMMTVKLRRYTKNHYGTMYFGALCMGAECVIGLLATILMQQEGVKGAGILFKDFKIDFLKRPEGDVMFVCEQGDELREQIVEARKSGQRVNREISGYGVVAEKSPTDPVIKFSLTISMKP